MVSNYIGLPVSNAHGQSEALTALLGCLKKGYGGNKRNGDRVMTGMDAVNLQDENNVTIIDLVILMRLKGLKFA